MSIGTLAMYVSLDDPNKIYHGDSDPVTGKVVVTFSPKPKHVSETGGELFGPIRITIKLHGRCKTKIWKRAGQHTHIYRGRVHLIAVQKTVVETQFRAQPGQTQQFPFQITFPTKPLPDFARQWDRDSRFQPEELLPPSFVHNSRGFGHHFESFIEYRINVDAVMPNIRVDIHTPSEYQEPQVKYERPRLTAPVPTRLIEGRGAESVSNETLIPPHERPSGFKQKMWIALTTNNFPTYVFDWKYTVPQTISLLAPITFTVTVTPTASRNVVPIVPDIYLSWFTVEIRACTCVRAEKQIFTSPEASAETTLATVRGVTIDKAPFSKANEWMKTVHIGKLIDFPSQFSTPNIARTYRLKVTIGFTVAGVDKSSSQKFPVRILPPMQSMDLGIGPSNAAAVIAASNVNVVPGNEIDTDLPSYEPPPTYQTDLKT